MHAFMPVLDTVFDEILDQFRRHVQRIVKICNGVNIHGRQRLSKVLLCYKKQFLEFLAFLPAAVLLNVRHGRGVILYILQRRGVSRYLVGGGVLPIRSRGGFGGGEFFEILAVVQQSLLFPVIQRANHILFRAFQLICNL